MSDSSPISSSTRTSATVQYTPSPTPSNLDPDFPLPSIERDPPSTSGDSESIPGSPIYTPSVSSNGATLRQGSEHQSLGRRFHDLRLGSVTPQRSISSPISSTPQREVSTTSPTPSIRITPTPPVASSRQSTVSRRIEGLVDGIGALQMSPNHQSTQSPGPNNLLGHASGPGRPNIGRSSPSPSRRRRSSSGVNQPPHRVEDEEPPESLFYERRVQEALNSARRITGRVARVLSESNMHQEQGSSVQSMYQQAARLSTFEPSSRRIVGLVGDSGVGKSSLINSLLDKMEFARAVSHLSCHSWPKTDINTEQSNNGAACTCVVTEYHYHDRNDYSIEIDYFSLQELQTQFEQLLSSLREYNSTTASVPTAMTAEERENRENLKRKADLATSTFRASFRERLDNNPAVLDVVAFDEAIKTMMTWVSQVLPPLGSGESDILSRESFDDIHQCSNRLKSLTSETEERDQACLWPFIRKLKFVQRIPPRQII